MHEATNSIRRFNVSFLLSATMDIPRAINIAIESLLTELTCSLSIHLKVIFELRELTVVNINLWPKKEKYYSIPEVRENPHQ